MRSVRPNVEVNRRAEGTSELNRRLGAVGKGAATLERCGDAGDYGGGLARKQAENAARAVPGWQSSKPRMGAECLSRARIAEQQASSQAASPEHAEVERQKPERGLTFELRPRPVRAVAPAANG